MLQVLELQRVQVLEQAVVEHNNFHRNTVLDMKEVTLLLGLEGNNEEDDAALNNVEETYEDAYVDGEEVAYEVASYEDDEVELYVSLHDEALQHDEGQRHDVVREHGVALGHGVVHDEERDEVHDEGAHVVREEAFFYNYYFLISNI